MPDLRYQNQRPQPAILVTPGRRVPAILLFAAAASVLAGCSKPPAPTLSQADHGLIWLLPGIEGGPATLCWAHAAFREAGVQSAIRVFDWERPHRPLDNLQDYEGNLKKAAQIAENIREYRQSHPTPPIDIVGYSGGGGLAIMVAEALPGGVRLRNIVLAQPALSPEYDLRPAMSRVDGKIVNLYCPTDWLTLGIGTRVFGTADRKKTDSAGKVGFHPKAAKPQHADKLEQHAWDLAWLGSGHFGNHLSILSYGWNQTFVAPYLMPCENGETKQQRE